MKNFLIALKITGIVLAVLLTVKLLPAIYFDVFSDSAHRDIDVVQVDETLDFKKFASMYYIPDYPSLERLEKDGSLVISDDNEAIAAGRRIIHYWHSRLYISASNLVSVAHYSDNTWLFTFCNKPDEILVPTWEVVVDGNTGTVLAVWHEEA